MISSSDPSRHHKFRLNPHIQTDRSDSKTVMIAVGVAAVAIIALGLYWYFGSSADAQQVILNVIALRKGTPEVVKRSALISKTDRLVQGLGSKRVQSEWDALAECLSKGCKDTDYYNFIITVITQKRVPNADLVYNAILSNKYWGTNEILEFSQALTKADTGVEELGSREVTKKWNEIIECDGRCKDKDDLFFQMIKAAVMAG